NGASNNRIGVNSGDADVAAEGNVISGNASTGIVISGAGTSGNVVAGNLVGTDATGTRSLGNGFDGIQVLGGATKTLIDTNGDGLGDAAERNVVAANYAGGIEVANSGTDGTVIAGNYFGMNISGLVALGNRLAGIGIWVGATNTRIGVNGGDIDAA